MLEIAEKAVEVPKNNHSRFISISIQAKSVLKNFKLEDEEDGSRMAINRRRTRIGRRRDRRRRRKKKEENYESEKKKE